MLDNKVAISEDGNNFSSKHLSDLTNQILLIPTGSNLFIPLPQVTNAPVSITIVAPNGRTIRSISLTQQAKEKKMVVGDCRDKNGKTIPAGIYLIHIIIQGRYITKSFVKL